MKQTSSLYDTIARSLLILLFVYAGGSKFADFDLFRSQMSNQPFPHWAGGILVYLVPVSEIVTAVLLFFDKTARRGLAWSAGIMLAFSIYTAIVLMHFFHYIPCSCGGVIQKLSWPQHLVFNLFFLGMAITGYLANRKLGAGNLTSSKTQTGQSQPLTTKQLPLK
jgi:putative oxidoreductase